MPIAPRLFKLKCLKCNYSKTVKPKSDTDIIGLMSVGLCPKCGGELERKELSAMAALFGGVFK